jgi:hypothetical protein
MKNWLFLLLFVLLAGLIQGCYYDKKETLYPPMGMGIACDTTAITFSGKIQPVLNAACIGCHNANNASGGHNLSTHAGVLASGSRLLGSVKHSSGYSAMPKNAPKLNDCQILIIEMWLQNGSLNN